MRGRLDRFVTPAVLTLMVAGMLLSAGGTGSAQSCTSPSFASPPASFTASNPWMSALADFDRDGKQDVAVANSTSDTVSIYLGNGAGGFTLTSTLVLTGLNPYSVRVADLNRDGRLDLVVANHLAATVSVFLGNGDGTFGAASFVTTAVAAGVADAFPVDLDGDGILDLASVNQTDGTVAFLHGVGNGTFGAPAPHPVGSSPNRVAVGDFSRDGRPDLAVTNGGSNTISILLGTGGGNFGAPSSLAVGTSPFDIVIADFNRDGRLDVLAGNDGSDNATVFLGNGFGAFGSASTLTGGSKITVADFNRDGAPDVELASNPGGTVSILLGNGDGTFAAGVTVLPGSAPQNAAVGDLDGDGRTDLVVGSAPDTITVLLNTAGIPCARVAFKGAQAFAIGTSSSPMSVVTGDFDGDGALDLATANLIGSASVLLGNGDGTLKAPVVYPAGPNSRSVASGDFNGDGRLDLAVANDGSNNVSILLGNGNGTFLAAVNYAAGTKPYSVAVGDFNGDGRFDLAVANDSGNVSVLLGSGNGTFQAAVNYAAGANPRFVAVGDFNADGKADLAVANSGGNNVSILLGNGDGTFQAPLNRAVGTTPMSLVTGDWNGDGRLDLAVTNGDSQNVSVLIGNGNGTFSGGATYTVGQYPMSITAGDLNGDGRLDLAVGVYYPPITGVAILLGNGNGTFQAAVSYTSGSGPQSVAAGDFNGDGKLDLAVANTASFTVSIHLGNGNGTFPAMANYAAGAAPQSIAVGDFNRDGKLDYAVANYNSNNMSVLLGNGNGTFANAVNHVAGTNPSSVAVGDFNGNGRLDLVVANWGSPYVSVFLGVGDGTFFAAVNSSVSSPEDVAVGDFNGDGRLDLAVTTTNSVSILIGNGNGTFQAAVPYTANGSSSVAVADLNRDGRLDLAVTNYGGGRVAILIGNGNGTFQNAVYYAVGTGPEAVAVGDLNGDGRLDLAVANYSSHTVSVLIGNGNGTFQSAVHYPAGQYPESVAVGDFNLDGKLDVVSAGWNSSGASIFLGNGDGTLQTAVNYAGAGAQIMFVAPGDFNGDGKPDLAVASAYNNNVSILLNTNCQVRWPSVATQVSACNVAGSPFSTQPVVEILDDGGNTIQCASGDVTASIVPGTGTGGATLSGTASVPLVSGLATYTDLSIDFPGRGYRLQFSQALAGTAFSRTFTQGLAPSITGPATVCQGTSPTYDAGGGYDTYGWTLDGGGTISTLEHVTLANPAAGLHTLQLLVTEDSCGGSTSLGIDVDAQLSAVSISMVGTNGVCPTCTGGTATVSDTGGGARTHQWGYRMSSGGSITGIAGETGVSYLLNAAGFPGVGNYYLVVTTTPTCGSAMVSNEIPVAVYTTIVGGEPVVALTVTSKDGENTVEWQNPSIGTYVATRIQYGEGSPTCLFPTGPFDGTNLVRSTGTAGAHDMATHSGLTNGTSYCYAAFVEQTGTALGDGRSTEGRPFDTSGAVKWAYHTGTAAMAPPGIGSAVYSESNDRMLHAMVRGAAGGVWPSGWTPFVMNDPSQHRPGVAATTVVPGASRVGFLGSQDGYVYALNGDTGAQLWQSEVMLGDAVQGAPGAILTAYGGVADYVFAGTWNAGTPNRVYALRASDGTIVNSFDNGGGGNSIGVISGGMTVDYTNHRLYFTSRAGGSANTLWCLEITPGGVADTCAGWTHQALGNVDAGPTLRSGVVYVGTNAGLVYALDALTGAQRWSFSTGDGPVKGFIFTDRFSNKLYFSTNGKVWGLVDNGLTVSSAWPAVSITDPSIVLFTPGSTYVLVGSSDGRLYQLDLSGAAPLMPPAITSVLLGEANMAVGSPSLDTYFNHVYVGSDAGIVYDVQLPLP